MSYLKNRQNRSMTKHMCPLCPATFAVFKNLKKHFKTHKSSNFCQIPKNFFNGFLEDRFGAATSSSQNYSRDTVAHTNHSTITSTPSEQDITFANNMTMISGEDLLDSSDIVITQEMPSSSSASHSVPEKVVDPVQDGSMIVVGLSCDSVEEESDNKMDERVRRKRTHDDHKKRKAVQTYPSSSDEDDIILLDDSSTESDTEVVSISVTPVVQTKTTAQKRLKQFTDLIEPLPQESIESTWCGNACQSAGKTIVETLLVNSPNLKSRVLSDTSHKLSGTSSDVSNCESQKLSEISSDTNQCMSQTSPDVCHNLSDVSQRVTLSESSQGLIEENRTSSDTLSDLGQTGSQEQLSDTNQSVCPKNRTSSDTNQYTGPRSAGTISDISSINLDGESGKEEHKKVTSVQKHGNCKKMNYNEAFIAWTKISEEDTSTHSNTSSGSEDDVLEDRTDADEIQELSHDSTHVTSMVGQNHTSKLSPIQSLEGLDASPNTRQNMSPKSSEILSDSVPTLATSEMTQKLVITDAAQSWVHKYRCNHSIKNLSEWCKSSSSIVYGEMTHRLYLKSFRCKYCHQIFHNFSRYSKHLHSHRRKLFRQTKLKNTKRKHLHGRRYLPLAPQRVESVVRVCSMCGKGFSGAAWILHYFNRCLNRRQCQYCEKNFDTSEEVRAHESAHLSVTPYKCSVCGHGFAVEKYYKMHLITHHQEVRTHESAHLSVTPYTCSVCGDRFAGEKYYKRHMINHQHEQEVEAYESALLSGTPYKCSVCGDVFAVENYYKMHMLTHQHGL